MKKLFFVFPIILLVAAACNLSTSQSTKEQSSSKQQSQSTNSPTTSPSQNQEPQTTNGISWETYTSKTLYFSVQYPSDWKTGSRSSGDKPDSVLYEPQFLDLATVQARVYFKFDNCPYADAFNCIKYHFTKSYSSGDPNWKFNSNNIQTITALDGLKGVYYDNYDSLVPNKLVIFSYPFLPPGAEGKGYSNPTMYIYMESTKGRDNHTDPISAEGNDIFLKMVRSFKFSNYQPVAAAPANSGAITLDAATKVAVTQAIISGYNILASKDVTKIRNYFETESQGTDQEAQITKMSDAQLLQLAENAVGNSGIPLASLATDSAADWKVDGNTVKVTHKTYALPNPKYPAISVLNVTYQAMFINGVWY